MAFSTILPVIVSCSAPAAPLPTSPNATITGTVLQRVDAPPYAFLRLETAEGQLWAAVPWTVIATKAKVTVTHGTVLRNFESRQAGRRFDAVVFGVLKVDQGGRGE